MKTQNIGPYFEEKKDLNLLQIKGVTREGPPPIAPSLPTFGPLKKFRRFLGPPPIAPSLPTFGPLKKFRRFLK